MLELKNIVNTLIELDFGNKTGDIDVRIGLETMIVNLEKN